MGRLNIGGEDLRDGSLKSDLRVWASGGRVKVDFFMMGGLLLLGSWEGWEAIGGCRSSEIWTLFVV
jgi:hypothetical protein